MQTHRLLVELEAPMAVSRSRDTANRYATPRVVPPTTLRGALAAAMDQAGMSADVREKVFGPNGCRTSALMPSTPGRAGRALATPLTLRTCKRHGGFRSSDSGGHGVEDLLFEALRFAKFEEAKGLRDLRLCQAEGCEQVLEKMEGILRTEGDETFRVQPTPDTRTQAHVGLDRRRRGTSAGVLYSREVISEKTSAKDGELHATQMQADVTGPDDVMNRLAQSLSPGGTMRIGTARSRGLGTCRVHMFEEVSTSDRIPTPLPLSARIDQFNERWHRRSGKEEGAGDVEETLVSLTLQTPALFVDEFLRPNLSPEGHDLFQAAFKPEKPHAEVLSDLERVHQIGRPTRIHSWNGMAEFPHRSAQGLAAGSVLVFRAEEGSEELLSALRRAEQAGIGRRRHFGFGRVRVCDPIHTHVHEHTPGSHE